MTDPAPPSDEPPIRQATPDDVPAIVTLLREMHGEVGMARLSDAKMFDAIADVLTRGICLLTLDPSGRPVGTIALLASEHWYSTDRFVGDLWLYVARSHRRTPHGRTLLRAARDYAATIGLPIIVGVLGPSRRLHAKGRIYQRIYGEPIGLTFAAGF